MWSSFVADSVNFGVLESVRSLLANETLFTRVHEVWQILGLVVGVLHTLVDLCKCSFDHRLFLLCLVIWVYMRI